MSELNEKILELVGTIECDTSVGGTGFVEYPNKVANAIELLILEEQLDMLKNMDGMMDILSKRMDLKQRINQLKG